MEEIIIETMEQAHRFFGGRKPITKMGAPALRRIKEEAGLNCADLGHAHLQEHDRAKRLHYNGAIACRRAIINKIDVLLNSKGLGVNRPT